MLLVVVTLGGAVAVGRYAAARSIEQRQRTLAAEITQIYGVAVADTERARLSLDVGVASDVSLSVHGSPRTCVVVLVGQPVAPSVSCDGAALTPTAPADDTVPAG